MKARSVTGYLILHDDDPLGELLARLLDAHEEAKGLGDEGAQRVWQCVRDILVETGKVER